MGDGIEDGSAVSWIVFCNVLHPDNDKKTMVDSVIVNILVINDV